MPFDMKCLLKFAGEFGNGAGDFWRLLAKRVQHPLSHLRLVANQLNRGHDERQVVVDVMAHRGQLLVQFPNFFHTEIHRLGGHLNHGTSIVGNGFEIKPL